MTEQTWQDFDEWWVQTGTTGNDYFHSSDDCYKLKNTDKAKQRSQNYIAYHEPEPCECCHPDVGDGVVVELDTDKASGQTSIFEMREIARDDVLNRPVKQLITSASVEEYPHRDYDVLKRVLKKYKSTNAMSEELGSDHATIRRWALVYDLKYPGNKPSKIRHRSRVLGDD